MKKLTEKMDDCIGLPCDICGKTLTEKPSFFSGMKADGTSDTMIGCPDCVEKFSEKQKKLQEKEFKGINMEAKRRWKEVNEKQCLGILDPKTGEKCTNTLKKDTAGYIRAMSETTYKETFLCQVCYKNMLERFNKLPIPEQLKYTTLTVKELLMQ